MKSFKYRPKRVESQNKRPRRLTYKRRMANERNTWEALELARIAYRCPDHPHGIIMIRFHPPSKSYLLYCNEKPKLDSKNFNMKAMPEIEKCFHHEHFDPEDWQTNWNK